MCSFDAALEPSENNFKIIVRKGINFIYCLQF